MKIFLKMIKYGVLVRVILNVTCKTDKYFDIKNCSCKKYLNSCEDEIVNTTQVTVKYLNCTTSFVDKKVTYEKNDCLIHTILLIIICLFY